MIHFARLQIEGWRQFDEIDISLHPRLTILTGANGAGKSTLLRLFSSHFGFPRHFLGTPTKEKGGGLTYLTGVFGKFRRLFTSGPLGGPPGMPYQQLTSVGALTYSNGARADILVPSEGAAQYVVQLPNQQPVQGIDVESHHLVSQYQQVVQIPASLVNPTQAYEIYRNEIVQKAVGGHTGFSPLYRMKETLISMAMFGEGNSKVEGNRQLNQAYDGFIESLRIMLPEQLGFVGLSIRPPEIVIITESGEFMLDSASGGLMALMDLTWRLHMFAFERPPFVVTIDEPENHLHPSLQKTLLDKMIKAFPSAQFIVATHSPFMVSAVRDSRVYALHYFEKDRKSPREGIALEKSIRSVELDVVNKAGSANEILRDVLGVSATIPEWVGEELEATIEKYRGRPINEEMLVQLRRELATSGYDHVYPEALASLLHVQ